jgi:hypothetical protein
MSTYGPRFPEDDDYAAGSRRGPRDPQWDRARDRTARGSAPVSGIPGSPAPRSPAPFRYDDTDYDYGYGRRGGGEFDDPDYGRRRGGGEFDDPDFEDPYRRPPRRDDRGHGRPDDFYRYGDRDRPGFDEPPLILDDDAPPRRRREEPPVVRSAREQRWVRRFGYALGTSLLAVGGILGALVVRGNDQPQATPAPPNPSTAPSTTPSQDPTVAPSASPSASAEVEEPTPHELGTGITRPWSDLGAIEGKRVGPPEKAAVWTDNDKYLGVSAEGSAVVPRQIPGTDTNVPTEINGTPIPGSTHTVPAEASVFVPLEFQPGAVQDGFTVVGGVDLFTDFSKDKKTSPEKLPTVSVEVMGQHPANTFVIDMAPGVRNKPFLGSIDRSEAFRGFSFDLSARSGDQLVQLGPEVYSMFEQSQRIGTTKGTRLLIAQHKDHGAVVAVMDEGRVKAAWNVNGLQNVSGFQITTRGELGNSKAVEIVGNTFASSDTPKGVMEILDRKANDSGLKREQLEALDRGMAVAMSASFTDDEFKQYYFTFDPGDLHGPGRTDGERVSIPNPRTNPRVPTKAEQETGQDFGK